MLISIITITYQSVATLKETVNSVLSQSCKNLEYIIVDGGSNDGTIEFLNQQGDKIRWISEPDHGIYNALNKGIMLAKGDYIGFLHSDDIFGNEQIIEKIYNTAKNNNPDIIYGDLEYVYKSDTEKVLRYWKSCDFKQGLLQRGWMPPHPTVYIKKAWYTKIGGFNETFKIAADYEFMLRLFSQPDIKTCHINDVVVKMRTGGTSNRSLSNVIQKMKEDYKALKLNKIGGIYSLLLKNLSKFNQFTSRKP